MATESTTAPAVNCTISHMPGVSLADLAAIRDETMRFQTDTGIGYTIRGAWLAAPPTLGGGGEVTLAFNGVECIEG